MQAFLVVVSVALIARCSSVEFQDYEYALDLHMGQFKVVDKIMLSGYIVAGNVYLREIEEILVSPGKRNEIYAEVKPGQTYHSVWIWDFPVDRIKAFSVEWASNAVFDLQRLGKSLESIDPITIDKVVITPLYDASAPPVSFCNKPGTPIYATKKLEMKKC